MRTQTKKVSVIGAGKIGTTLGVLLKRAGYIIEGVSDRNVSSCEKFIKYVKMGKICKNNKEAAKLGEIIFITTNDDNIERVSREIKDFCKNKFVIHCSGALTTDALKCKNSEVSSIHPIQAVSCPKKGIISLPGSYFDVQCSDSAWDFSRNMVHDIGGIPIRLTKEEKIMNHIASCFVSNYSVALFNIAMEIHKMAGIGPKKSEKIMMPLFEQNVENIKRAGAINALTGPIERGDIETVKMHLKSLKERKWIKSLYMCLGRSTLNIAKKKGLDPKKYQKIKELLEGSVV